MNIVKTFLKAPWTDDEIRILLFRHGHREKTWGHEADNGLSERGRAQVAEWSRMMQEIERSPEDAVGRIRVFSSPKSRCQETLSPWSETWAKHVEVDQRLDEQGVMSDAVFVGQVRDFLSTLASCQLGNMVVLCSHGDWIPLFVEMATGQRVNLGTAGCVLIQLGRSTAESTRVFPGEVLDLEANV